MYVFVFRYDLDGHPEGHLARTMRVLAPRKADAEVVLRAHWERFNCKVVALDLVNVEHGPMVLMDART